MKKKLLCLVALAAFLAATGFVYAETCTQVTVDDEGEVHHTVIGGEGWDCEVSGGRCHCARVN